MQTIRSVHNVTGPTLTISVPAELTGTQVEVLILPLEIAGQASNSGSAAASCATKTIEIVDRGRGPQLSTCRITVQDVVPYLQNGSSYGEILQAMPILSVAEIQAIERYVEEHKSEVMEEDRRIREENAGRKNPPEVEAILAAGRAERLARAEARRRERQQEAGGERHSG